MAWFHIIEKSRGISVRLSQLANAPMVGLGSGNQMIKIKQGQIHINDVWITYDTPECKIFYVDCRAKYPRLAMYSGRTLYLDKGPNTLKAEDVDVLTEIGFELDNDKTWNMEAVVGRYSIDIFVWTEPGIPYAPIWSDSP